MKIRVPFFVLLLMVGLTVVQRLEADGGDGNLAGPTQQESQTAVETLGNAGGLDAALYSASLPQAVRAADVAATSTLPIVLAGAR